MLRNFIKTTLRNLWKNKSNSFLNIFGLALGIACAGLIFLWVEDELHYDAVNLNKDRIFLVRTNAKFDDGIHTHSSTPGVLGPALQQEIPGIAKTCRVTEDQTSLLFDIGDKPVYASGKYAESSLFEMFTLPFVEGDPKTAFNNLYSIVITEKTAKKFFGEEKNILGRTIRVDKKQDYVVTGVLKDIPENSSLQFEWVAPFKVFYDASPWARKWENSCLTTYVELNQTANVTAVERQLANFLQTKTQGSTSQLILFGMPDWHLYDQFVNGKKTGGGQITYVHLFSLIAWIILFIACVNFMNLSTARSEKRAREVGVRKVLGAGRKLLVLQFIGEAVSLSVLATVVSVLLMTVILPFYNSLVQKNLSLGLDQPIHILFLLLIAIVCGLFAGSYPSFYLSSFKPVFVLKGIKMKSGSAAFIRQGLVVVQFTISIILIIGTLVIYTQLQHVKNRELGFNKNNLLQMNLQGSMKENFTSLKQDLLQTGIVENAALTDHETIYSGNNTSNISWQGKNPNSEILISQRLISPEFISTSGMKLVSGRDFNSTDLVEMSNEMRPKDPGQIFNIVITQSLEKIMGKESALGKSMEIPVGPSQVFQLRVIGVVKDYVYGDMYGKPDPVIFYCLPQATSLLYVRIKDGQPLSQALVKIAGVMKKDNPAYPFEFRFVDDQFNEIFTNEMLMSKLSRVFAVLAIIISCLGLFGLAAYTAERRTREIGVRKVLGADVAGIAGLISKDFIKLVFISSVLAFPVAWYVMNNWLQNYAYRVAISWWIFVSAGVLAILIALLTVSFQAVKAALANPVKSLRTE